MIFFILLINSCARQTVRNIKEDYSCERDGNMIEVDRLNQYPFNASSKVAFISYKQKKIGIDGTELSRYLKQHYEEKSKIVLADFHEFTYLTKENINELTDLFYNYGINYDGPLAISGCYSPRNAILFLDNDNHLLNYIEICFECGRVVLSDDHINLGSKCYNKLYLLQDLFMKFNINYVRH